MYKGITDIGSNFRNV